MPLDYDAELRLHTDALRRHWNLHPHDRVLDIGCGAGQTTREAAALTGSAFGIDVSAAAIERAQASGSGPDVQFTCGDVQTYAFSPHSFDVAISRFGTMFFTDPPTAFSNIARALRPAGRLAMLVWQPAPRNEWDVSIRQALPAPEAPEAFSLSDPAAVRPLLEAAGFTEVAFTDVHEPVYYGSDVETALTWVRGFTCVQATLTHPGAGDRLRDLFAAHSTPDGIWFDARSWMVTARESSPAAA
ncbi:class I SAM-dependent methyltransferase [Paractinoplanes atraurantiacus]|uniref:Ubiquinone/menaquinone biosynthesis C-methylase UbiE n=1 Tax=Paractinoplanes atraurantiacus TaxID=1036182 RepID=A0A285K4N9_9ACTN|nr:class I SAM-dependent methyltransferase [Actinoplanes atraurantiacus]SNY67534.1 Ubiquinone/menaquinone biosynthesis C-methylase UbiE [Actinoplanes atraurantiacus]